MHPSLSFGELIRKSRLEKQYSLRQFAKMVGLSCAFISRMERDDIDPPTEERISTLAKLLDLDKDKLTLLAKRLPKDMENMLIERPQLFAFLRTASKKTDAELEELF